MMKSLVAAVGSGRNDVRANVVALAARNRSSVIIDAARDHQCLGRYYGFVSRADGGQ